MRGDKTIGNKTREGKIRRVRMKKYERREKNIINRGYIKKEDM